MFHASLGYVPLRQVQEKIKTKNFLVLIKMSLANWKLVDKNLSNSCSNAIVNARSSLIRIFCTCKDVDSTYFFFRVHNRTAMNIICYISRKIRKYKL